MGETLVRLTRDGLRFARMRYGVVAGPLFDVAEKVLERVEENIAPDETPRIA